MCDFLLVINTNVHPISHHFQVIADYWSYLRFRQGVPVFNTVAQGGPLNSGPRHLSLKKLEGSLYRRVLTDDYFVLSQCMRLTDRQMDGQTDADSNSAP